MSPVLGQLAAFYDRRIFERRLMKTRNSYILAHYILYFERATENWPRNTVSSSLFRRARTRLAPVYKKWYLCAAAARAFDINDFSKLHFCVCPTTMAFAARHAPPSVRVPVALGRLIAEPDTAGYTINLTPTLSLSSRHAAAAAAVRFTSSPGVIRTAVGLIRRLCVFSSVYTRNT